MRDDRQGAKTPAGWLDAIPIPWRLGVLAILSSACGYRAAYADAPAKLHVVLARSLVADAASAAEVVRGAREELLREGALEAGEGYPRLEIELLRADETSEGIAAVAGEPRARATEVAVVARAWIAPESGQTVRDTGDMTARDVVAPEIDARADELRHADAMRAVARRLGAKLARKALGQPAAGE